jgi:AraC-like DNA-binding protein
VVVAEVDSDLIRFSHNPEIAGVESELIENSPRLWHRFHDTYCVTAVVDASRTAWRLGREHRTATTGDVCFACPGDLTVTTSLSSPQAVVSLMITPALVAQFADAYRIARRPVAWRSLQAAQPGLCGKLVELEASLRKRATSLRSRVILRDVLRLLFTRCVERRALQDDQSLRAPVARAREYIEQNYQQQLTLCDIAKVADVSRFHLTRIFAAEFGVTPRAYLLYVRLARAKALLALGQRVQQVAMDAGFSDQSHFTRNFRQTYGVTPAAYQEAIAHV